MQTLTKAVSDLLVKTYLNVCGVLSTYSLISRNEEELLSDVPPKHCRCIMTHPQMLSKRSFGSFFHCRVHLKILHLNYSFFI